MHTLSNSLRIPGKASGKCVEPMPVKDVDVSEPRGKRGRDLSEGHFQGLQWFAPVETGLGRKGDGAVATHHGEVNGR